jgi:hypothetical protein
VSPTIPILIGADTTEYKQDLDDLKAETDRVQTHWQKVRREVISDIRKTMAVMRRAVHIVVQIFRQFGIELGPFATAVIEAGFAICTWILSIEAAISAGTFGAGAAAAAVLGGIAIAMTLVAGWQAETALAKDKQDLLRNADIMESIGDIAEMLFLD